MKITSDGSCCANGQLQAENVSLKTGQQSLQQENEALRAQQTGVAAIAKSLGDLAKSVEENKSERKDRMLLVDAEGLGKPETFNNDEPSFRRWARTVCNLTVGMFGKEFQDVLDYCLDLEDAVDFTTLETKFGMIWIQMESQGWMTSA